MRFSPPKELFPVVVLGGRLQAVVKGMHGYLLVFFASPGTHESGVLFLFVFSWVLKEKTVGHEHW